jgi:DNA-binding NtrC family response regulator
VQPRKVLIVDDDQAIRDELAAALGDDARLELSVADDGKTALDMIATGRFWPDAILLDLMMPRLDGEIFLAALDAIRHTNEIDVVAMTALPPSGVPEAIRRRARSILFKPFTVAQVVAALDTTLQH